MQDAKLATFTGATENAGVDGSTCTILGRGWKMRGKHAQPNVLLTTRTFNVKQR